MIRKTLTGILALGVVLFGAVTLTVPAYAATAPAILTVAIAVGAYFMWPKRVRA